MIEGQGWGDLRSGITIKNVEQVHIVNPWYNYGKIIQAVARAIRFGSHEQLLKERNINY